MRANYSAALRHELSLRNATYAQARGLSHVESTGTPRVFVYKRSAVGATHGNFLDASYKAILGNPKWNRRLEKVHTHTASLPQTDERWKELDSSMSSDALLMNIFCHPEITARRTVALRLGFDVGDVPEFGFPAGVPRNGRNPDRTEVDMKLGSLLAESKLTETDFQVQRAAIVESYKDFREVFDQDSLPRLNGQYASYQLIRNVLAAHDHGLSFCVLHDARRPDLREAWFAVMSCVKSTELKTRCKVLTWQELAELLPEELQDFLDHKYGIVAPGCVPSPCGANLEDAG
jgi:hypothetical protein